jgi:crotonobetainyl-CoA:carnitine CoA-transferase CaiB-like acyl-CoA transferase
MNPLPFEGLRIIDFTHDWVGPFSTRILADFGAEVIKIEYVKRLCAFRGGRLENQMYNRHPRWYQVNRNKLSVTLDLKVEKDLQAVKDLVKVSDILVNNSRPGVMEKFGLSYDELKQLKDDIILVSLSAFGNDGPFSNYAGYGATIEPMSGLPQLTAYKKNGKRYRIREMDVINGMMAAAALVTALLHRQNTGEGQHVDLSQMETATHALLAGHLLEFLMQKSISLPVGNRHPNYAPQGCYRCKGDDKWVALTIRSEAEWQKFCDIIGRPELFSDRRFETAAVRITHHDELDRHIESWTVQHTHYDVVHMLQNNGIPAGAVLNASELTQDDHLKQREYFISAGDGTRNLFPGMLAQLSIGSARLFRKGPDLGFDNEYVLCDIIGRSQDEITPLKEDQIGTAYDPE